MCWFYVIDEYNFNKKNVNNLAKNKNHLIFTRWLYVIDANAFI